MTRKKFPASVRLKGANAFSALVKSGRSFHAAPLRIIWKENSSGKIMTGISVPKRNFKKAADRNLLKRRIRESYRKHYSEVKNAATESGTGMNVLIIYTGKQKVLYSEIEQKMKISLQKLLSRFGSARNTQA